SYNFTIPTAGSYLITVYSVPYNNKDSRQKVTTKTFNANTNEMTNPTISLNKSSYSVGEKVDISWAPTSVNTDFYQYWLVIKNTTDEKEYYGGASGRAGDVNANHYTFTIPSSGNYQITVYSVPYYNKASRQKYTTKTFSAATKLSAPTAKVTVNANGSFTISWNAVTGAEKYDVYYDNGAGYKLLRTVTDTSTTTATAPYGKKYSYKVRAVTSKNSSATSNYSNVVSTTNTKKLQTPTAKAVVNANGSFTISWNAVTGATKYDVYYSSGAGYKLLRSTTDTSTTTSTAPYGKKYSYKVRAVTSKNSSATSAFSSVVTATNNKKLQAPTIKAVVNANGSFTISWNAVTGAEKYDVYYNSGTGYKLFRTVTGTLTTTAIAAKGKTYSYKVRAVTNKSSSATSNYSNVVSVANMDKLRTPTAKIVTNTNGSFTISWNAISGAEKYGVYYDNGAGYKLLRTVTGTSITTSQAPYGKKYSYKVRAVTSKNSSATSNYSNVVSATNTKKLQTPTAKAVVNANGSFTISWNAVAGATSYQLYIKQADGSYRLMKTTTAISYTTAVAAQGKTYSYKVRAVTNQNSSAASNYSNVVSATRK
ncbi:MAG: hypothetical protein K2F65_00550, partial [Eubacterium sp.]|nr:hypothetical protein [Eubacterium sp.]